MQFATSYYTPTSNTAQERSAVEIFLEALWDQKPSDLFLLLWTRQGKQSRWFRSFLDAAAFAEQIGRKTDVYVGVGLAKRDYGPTKRCPKEEIIGIAGLWADIDLASPAHPHGRLPRTVDDALSLFPPEAPPSAVVSTGNGIHTWWLLKEPAIFGEFDSTEDEDRQRVADLALRWQTLLQENSARRGWDFVRLADLSRVLRIPGTLNLKDPRQPKAVELLSLTYRRYNLSDFEEILENYGISDTEILGEKRAQLTERAAIQIDLTAEISEELIHKWCMEDPRFRATWERRRDDMQDVSQSGYDMALADFGVRRGLSDQEIVNLIVHHRRLYKQEPRQRPDYFIRTIAKAREHAQLIVINASRAAMDDRKAVPRIQATGRQLREIVVDAWNAIHCANVQGCEAYALTPFLFQRGGRLVRLAMDETGPEIEEMNEDGTIGLLTRVADWFRVTKDAEVSVLPPREVARDLLAYPDPRLPALESVTTTPVFSSKGELILAEGYHSDERLWLAGDERLHTLEVPEHPTAEQVAAARDLLLNDLLVDFPFVDTADRAHAVAALILPFVRRMIDGPTPLHLIEAPVMGSGKGLLANLISIVATGAPCEARTLPENEDETRKMLTAELLRGRPIILLDNASDRRQLHSSALASVLTSTRWTDRKLGVSIMVSAPNYATWLCTGNNPQLHLELARRCIRIRIDPKVDRPWRRSGFKHPEIAVWAREYRAELVQAALTLVRAWIAAGRPMGRERLGSFESWSAVMGGILEIGGIQGFLKNLEELYETADTDGGMWREFIATWWEEYGEDHKTVKELNTFCETRGLMLRVRGDGGERSQQTRLGGALNRNRDRVFGGLQIIKVERQTKHVGPALYMLKPLGTQSSPQEEGGMKTLKISEDL